LKLHSGKSDFKENTMTVLELYYVYFCILLGAQLGTVIAMPICGILADSDFLGGWPSVFYVFGK
jgi:hypothetical protein